MSTANASESETQGPRGKPWLVPLAAAAVVTLAITALSWLLPSKYAATGVGVGFLGATWWLVLRRDEADVRAHGLSLGGLFEREPLSARRLVTDGARALAWALAVALVFFPPFIIGYRIYWKVAAPFALRLPPTFLDDVAGQLLVIALPEEAFFRGYLQTALDRAWPGRVRVLGAELGWSVLAVSAIFAVGHVLTEPHPGRLAVFFPSLVFCYMRARTGGIGASLAFHAMCNLFVVVLSHGFGLAR